MRFFDPHDESRGPHLVEIPRPGDPYAEEWLVVPSVRLQCVGRTQTGRRCRNYVMDGRRDRVSGGLALRWSTAGVIGAYQMGGSADALRAWREQRCVRHDTPDAVDACAVEWRPYSAEHDAAHFTQPIPPLPRLPEPGQDWSEVPDLLLYLWRQGRFQREHLGMPAGATYTPGQGWTA